MAKRKAATVDIEFIKHSLGISGFGFAGIQMYFQVKRWMYRLGTSGNTDGQSTSIQVFSEEDPSLPSEFDAYLSFLRTPTEDSAFRRPSLTPDGKRCYANYDWRQLSQFEGMLQRISSKPTFMLFWGDGSHSWAELHQVP